MRPGQAASRLDLPEMAGVEPSREPLTSSVRLFYAAMSPVALFWVPEGDIGPLGLPLVELVRLFAAHAEHGTIRGFAPNPFLPVLVRAPWSAGVLTWTSEASEFELGGLPTGAYRVRALDLFGRVTFASGATVGPGQRMGGATRLWSKLNLDEPDSREVMGFVRWESGAPVARAVVFMQNTYNFRRFFRRVETDDSGFFRFGSVPAGESYFAFALPPDEQNGMREFDYFGMPAQLREVWRELTLHPHRVTGVLVVARTESVLQLVRVDGGKERVIWSFRAAASGRFTIGNVPHGTYRVQTPPSDRGTPARSLPFEVMDGRQETFVQWRRPLF